MRLTEQEYAELNRRLAERATRVLQSGAAAAAPVKIPRMESRLESELAGHLSVMGIATEREFRFHPERRWRFDFAFPDQKLAVEIQGGIFLAEKGKAAGGHSRGRGQMKHFEKVNAAVELGWRVLLFGPDHITSGEAALQIARILGL